MTPDPSSSYLAQIIFLLFLIIINAFFAASETAIVSVNRNRIKILAQDGNKKAILVQELLEEPNQFLSTIQIAITLAGFLSSASAAVGMSDDLGGMLTSIGIPYAKPIAVFLVTVLLSYFSIVLGELYPKRLAMNHTEGIAMATVKPILFISKVAKPFVFILSISLNALLKITRQDINPNEESFSEDEVKSMLEVGIDTGHLDEEGKKMIDSVFEFDDKLAYEIMTPRTDVFCIDLDDPIEEYLDDLMDLGYTRIPVYREDLDNIEGIINIKDYFMKAKEIGFENVNIDEIKREAYFIPRTKKIDDLFFELQENKNQIAIVIDEYGGFSGIVTTEDIIEEIFGEIEDEYDDDDVEIENIAENIYIVNGLCSLDDINEELNLKLDSEDSETIGGFIIDLLGEILDENAIERVIETEQCTFTILSVKERRIEKIKIEVTTSEEINDGMEQ